ncbi:MAG: glycoside hydrolase family 16 protein, partial [Spirochaetia bacterium]|nr:glycoside hydrolase family 16 protein [Spirochaetia bacterium]
MIQTGMHGEWISRTLGMLACLCLGVFGAEVAPAEKVLDGKTYWLSFDEEFDGKELDPTKWEHRGLGPSATHKQIWTKDGAFLDGQGRLVMLLYTKDKSSLGLTESNAVVFPGKWVPHTAMLRTKKEFTFGYHEVRFTMPIVKGVGMSVWMQSRGNTRPNPSPDPKQGAEIDLIEQTFFDKYGTPVDFKHSTIHWGGYAATHSWLSIDVRSK